MCLGPAHRTSPHLNFRSPFGSVFVSRKTIAIALLALAGLMLFGFLRSSASIAAPATIVALLITVVAPAVGGIAMLRGTDLARGKRLDQLRQQTIDAEVLRLAVTEGGSLTAQSNSPLSQAALISASSRVKNAWNSTSLSK